MSSSLSGIDTGMLAGVVVSAVIHLAVFLLLAWSGQLFPSDQLIQETYYVDMVDLPALDPQSGGSAPLPEVTKALPLPAALPVTKAAPAKIAQPPKPIQPQEPAETADDFAERLSKLEKKSEARREEAVIEKLRSRVKAGERSKTGAPAAGGADAGSRYADFIKSRLEDALKVTSSYSTKQPEVVVRLTISADGRSYQVKIERSSGDAAFELAVRRAIDLASEKFTATPNRATFENGFVFRPKGISNGTLR